MARASTSKIMVLIRLTGAISITLGLLTCSTASQTRQEPSTTSEMNKTLSNENEDCKITVNLKNSNDTSLICSIEISNLTNAPLYFFNGIYYGTKMESTSSEIVYSFIETDTLVLTKAIVPVPDDMDVEKPIYPCATKAMPNGTLTERFTLDLPIRHHHPYDISGNEPRRIKSTIFRFGYFKGVPNTDEMGSKIRNSDGKSFLYFDPFDYRDQRIIQVGAFRPLPFQVDQKK